LRISHFPLSKIWTFETETWGEIAFDNWSLLLYTLFSDAG
jgi:hypothetical protein